LSYFAHSPVLKSAQSVTYNSRNLLPTTHDNFCKKYDVKTVSSKVQVLRIVPSTS